ncbi:MAG: NB-ARC domain-containing protein, partial [Lachnospiraceae bacterium]|nr:NB-ARC domain-containing protein [Lachnospiraceae bacterium]
MLDEYSRNSLIQLADVCISLRDTKRPEAIWLGSIYDEFRKAAGGLSKKEADALLYQRMYGMAPQSATDVLKIRFWRTGRHVPSRRSECTAFGSALGLSGEQLTKFLCFYYDHSDYLFEKPPADGDELAETYRHRLAILHEITEEYMNRIHPLHRRQLHIPSENRYRFLRHTYYLDAVRYTSGTAPVFPHRHIDTVAYDAEFTRQMKLLGEIPRKTVIRHLFLLTQPFTSRKRLDELLCELGYLPLNQEHTTVTGDHLDSLIIDFLSLYEERCSGSGYKTCSRWLIDAYRYLDRYLNEQGEKTLRFLYFKALGSSSETLCETDGKNHRKKQDEFEKELLEWEKLQVTLRKEYADTPAGFKDEKQIANAEHRIQQRILKYEEEHTSRLVSHAPPADEIFAGRGELLESIRQSFADKNRNQPVILYGIGGMGKSALAREYMRKYAQLYDEMLFLHIITNVRSAINDDSQVQISNLQYSQEEFENRSRYFERKIIALKEIASVRRLLIIIDDLNTKLDKDMKKLFDLPCHILVTTRVNPSLWGIDTGIYVGSLERQSELDAFINAYSRRHLNEEEQETLKKYYEQTGGHTLLMKLAVSTFSDLASEKTLSIQSGARVRVFRRNSASDASDCTREILEDLFSRFALKTNEKQAMRELSILPVQGISHELYAGISGVSDETLERLSAFMLINIDGNQQITLHPLVAEAARQVFAPTLSNCREMVGNFCDSLYSVWDQTFRKNQEMSPYVFSILRAFPHPLPEMARQLEQLATWLWIQEYYKESESWCARIVSSVEEYYGKNHQLTGEMYLRMAAVYHNSLDNDNARIWYQNALDVLKTCVPVDHRYDRLLSLAYTKMARVYMREDNPKQALAYIRQTLELEQKYQKTCGRQSCTDPYSLASETVIQSIYLYESQVFFQMERYEEGEAICRKVREKMCQLYPDGIRLNEYNLTLINFLMARGELGEAEKICRESLERAIRYRGTHFKDTLECME